MKWPVEFCCQKVFAVGQRQEEDQYLAFIRFHQDQLEVCVLGPELRWLKLCRTPASVLQGWRIDREIFDNDLFIEAVMESWVAGECRLSQELEMLTVSHDSFSEPLQFPLEQSDNNDSVLFSVVSSLVRSESVLKKQVKDLQLKLSPSAAAAKQSSPAVPVVSNSSPHSSIIGQNNNNGGFGMMMMPMVQRDISMKRKKANQLQPKYEHLPGRSLVNRKIKIHTLGSQFVDSDSDNEKDKEKDKNAKK